MKLYLAAPDRSRVVLAAIAAKFERFGHTISDQWWALPRTTDEDLFADYAVRRFDAVVASDMLILVNTTPRGAQASELAVEFGVALAHYKPILLIGEPTNIFHYLPNVVVSDTVDDAVLRLADEG